MTLMTLMTLMLMRCLRHSEINMSFKFISRLVVLKTIEFDWMNWGDATDFSAIQPFKHNRAL